MVTKNVVLADGTYATQTVYSEPKAKLADLDKPPTSRKMLVGGDIFLGTIVSSCSHQDLPARAGRWDRRRRRPRA